MISIKEKIANYVKLLKPSDLGLKRNILIKSIEPLGKGMGNFNYLLVVNDKRFVFRINASKDSKGKSKKEFDGLKLIEKLNIGPKALVFEKDSKYVGSEFIILSYIEGETVDKTEVYFKDSMIEGIARLLAKMHSIKIAPKIKKELPINEISKKNLFVKLIDNYLNYIKKHVSNKEFLEMINSTASKIKEEYDKIEKTSKLVLSQGDVCAPNVLYHKGEFKLIDFEHLQLVDPVEQIAHISVDFGIPFDERQKKLFLKEYLKIRKEKNLESRVNRYIPILYFVIFLWAVEYALKVKNKEFNNDFLKDHDIEKDYEYIDIMFKRNIGAGVIGKEYQKLDVVNIIKMG